MQRPFEFPTCLTNFSREEKRALDKMLDGRVQQFVEEFVEHAKKKAKSEGRELERKSGEVTVSTLPSPSDTGHLT